MPLSSCLYTLQFKFMYLLLLVVNIWYRKHIIFLIISLEQSAGKSAVLIWNLHCKLCPVELEDVNESFEVSGRGQT